MGAVGAAPTRPLVFTGALVWDGLGFLPGTDVVAHGGRIVNVTRRAHRPAGARIIPAHGATLLPGLIDCHTHFGPLGPADSTGARMMSGTGAATLASGVTTARVHFFDNVRGPAFARLAETPGFPAPRLRLGGPALVGGQPDLDTRVMRGVKSAEDGVAKIRTVRAIGATWVSIEDIELFPPEVLTAVVTEARAQGLRLMVMTITPRQLELGAAVGADSLDHGLGEVPYDLTDMRRYHSAMFAIVLGYYRNLIALRRDPSPLDDPRPYRFMTPEAASREKQRVKTFLAEAPSPRETRYADMAANFRALYAAGAAMVIASDSGSDGQFHTDAVWNEMAAWRAAGIGMDDILRSATSRPAALLREPDIGRIGPGARADLALYRGDIRDGAFDPRRVAMVVKAGIVMVEDGALTTA